MQERFLKIKEVIPNSLVDDIGILPGDELISINKGKIYDLLDYKFYSADDFADIKIRRGKKTLRYGVFNDDFEELGFEFEDVPLKSCENNCVFCFINQLPRGLRKTLYFKDDDLASSFLQGNYITLTNLTKRDFKRIRKMKIGNINISVHSTNGKLRAQMMNNKKAANIMKILQKFTEWDITMNCQVVLMKGANDQENLRETLRDLSGFYPFVQSVSVVPVGLSCHRENLPKLDPFTKSDAENVLKIIEECGAESFQNNGTKLTFAADEFYILAEQEMPTTEHYEQFWQLENGVGLVSVFKEEFLAELAQTEKTEKTAKMSIITGVLAAPMLKELFNEFTKVAPNFDVNIYAIENKLFGEKVTVAGLVCGGDIINQLKNKDLGEKILIPSSMLNSDDIFLDDKTVEQVEVALKVKVEVVDVHHGSNLIKSIL